MSNKKTSFNIEAIVNTRKLSKVLRIFSNHAESIADELEHMNLNGCPDCGSFDFRIEQEFENGIDAVKCMECGCDYARNKGGLGKPFVENVGIREFIISCSIVLIAGLVLLQTQFIAVMIAPICFTIAAILYLKKRLGGITGDVLGALNELMEVVSLSSFLFFW